MLQTTKLRHEILKNRLEQIINDMDSKGIKDYVNRACEILHQETGFSKRTLRNINYEV